MTAGPEAACTAGTLLDRIGARWLQRGWLSANNIVFPGDAGQPAAVVDTGYLAHADQTLALVRHALGGKPLDTIINTHLHSDHCGGNAALRATWAGARISVPAGYRDALSPWDEARLSYRDTGQACAPFTADHFICDGEELELGGRRWQIHATPGHDPDALVFYEPENGVLISGDALWADRLAIIFPALADPGAGFDDAFAALDLIERLRPRWVLPGHGPVFSDLEAALTQSRRRLEAFAQHPLRHRQYAVRALATYHMLEHRRQPYMALAAWMSRTPIFLRALGSPGTPEQALEAAMAVLDRLVADGILLRQGEDLVMPDQAA